MAEIHLIETQEDLDRALKESEIRKMPWDVRLPVQIPLELKSDLHTPKEARFWSNILQNFEYNRQQGNIIFKDGNWMYNKPYQVISIVGHCHTLGGHWGDNDYYAHPRDEEPTIENLLEFNGVPCSWGMILSSSSYVRNKWDESSIENGQSITITRNGAPFYTTHGIFHALDLLEYLRANEHPLDLQDYGYDKTCIGRKVWWKGQKAIVSSWVEKGQACVILTPDPEIGKFACPPEYAGDEIMWHEENESELKIDIFSPSVDWFRNR